MSKSPSAKPVSEAPFVFRLYLVALVITGTIFAALSWHVYYSYQMTRDRVVREMRLKELSGVVVHLDEVLTMSARMAVVTGEPRWEERYRRYETELAAAILEIRRLVPADADTDAAAQSESANIRRTDMENRAFMLVRQGQSAEGREILFSKEYEIQKWLYAEGIKRLSSLWKHRADTMLAMERERTALFAAVIVIVLPLLFIAWVVVLWHLHRWHWALSDSREREQHYIHELEQDIARRKQAEAALFKSEQRFQLITRATNDAVWDWDLTTSKVWWNEGIHSLFGYEPAQVGSDVSWWLDRVHPEDRDRVDSGMQAAIRGEQQFWVGEYRCRRADGSYADVYDRGYVIRENGKPVRMIGAMLDVTTRKEAEQRLQKNAFYDAVTDLPNRALFMDRLGQAVERSKRRKEYLAATLFFDLDRFKIVNESLGHAVGDQLLIAIAQRLEGCLRLGDTFARLGGDEFAVLLEDLKDASEATRVADAIQKGLTVPFNLNGQEIFIGASIGIALTSTGYDSPEDLLRDAETAMYRAKSHGKGRYELFDADMHARAVAFLRLEAELRRAIERQELFLYYQPMVSLKTGRMTGCEALVRWRHPQRGIVSPNDFIPVAEETGLIAMIGDWVLREACRQNRAWLDAGLGPWCVTVNISARQFKDEAFSARVAQILHETNLPPECLRLELTESAIMEDMEQTIAMLWELKGLGIELSMDDFGTGYSSLGYLSRFPFDVMKMDRSFVRNTATNPHDARIAIVVIALAHSLKLKVIAEGVETSEQLAFLRAQWCDEIQGHIFSPAVPPEAIVELVQQGRCLEEAI